MSRTKRKDKEGNVFWDGRPTRKVGYRCRCTWCTGVDKRDVERKILDKEMKRQLDDALEWNYTENKLLTKYRNMA